MQHEFLSAFSLLQARDDIQRTAIDFLLGRGQAPSGLGHLAEVTDPLARVDLLAQALLTAYKDYARAGSRQERAGLPQLYRSPAFQEALAARRQQMTALGLLPTLPDLAALPAGSFAIYFSFILRAPYLSKDDVGLHILDNPVRKDKVFGLPMVASSSWKGALRAAIVAELAGQADKLADDTWVERRLQVTRLFGNEKYAEESDDEFDAYLDRCKPAAAQAYRDMLKARYSSTGFMAGRLSFYPTFFTQLGLEVINPHDRRSNAGSQPIYLECVPAGAEGEFALLYVPFDRIGNETADPERRLRALSEEVAEDLSLVTTGIEALLIGHGIGAKTSAGNGTARAEFVKDEQGKAQAFVQVKGIGRYCCRNFGDLRQAAEALGARLREAAGGAA